uniref:DUF7915 domain-containing protein n=1 Tax=Manihot esculenta TaxID=3983 RepID=A0A2C9W0S9_MANES
MILVWLTGINERDLVVLEKHVVYSTSKEKAAACFYIMQCTQPNNHITQIPIKDAISRFSYSTALSFTFLMPLFFP